MARGFDVVHRRIVKTISAPGVHGAAGSPPLLIMRPSASRRPRAAAPPPGPGTAS